MRIVFFETTKGDTEYIAGTLSDHTATCLSEPLNAETAPKAANAEIVSVFINSRVDKAALDALPNVKLITTRSTGYDHIDTAAAASRGISVASVPAYGSRTVAEFTFGLILTAVRKIFDAYHQLREGSDFNIERLRGMELYGKTLGIVGTGRIGKHVARIAQGFGMRTIAFDLAPDQPFAQQSGMTYVPLDKLLAQSDIITLHLPATPQTHHIINAKNIGSIKRGAYLINTARGDLVETSALLDAMRGGQLAGAALDVLEEEQILHEEARLFTGGAPSVDQLRTLIADHILIDLPQVIVTPHIAFFTGEAKLEMLKTSIENIAAFIAGTPQNLITR